jgi:hypothetical protein
VFGLVLTFGGGCIGTAMVRLDDEGDPARRHRRSG